MTFVFTFGRGLLVCVSSSPGYPLIFAHGTLLGPRDSLAPPFLKGGGARLGETAYWAGALQAKLKRQCYVLGYPCIGSQSKAS